jgi:short-subunit dehydrogenase
MPYIVKDKTALITGGSTGIGFELARLLAADGSGLVLLARNQEKLQKAADALSAEFKVPVKTIAADLAQVKAAQEVTAQLVEWNLSIDILINNAGIGDFAPFAESDPGKIQDMLITNINSLTLLTQNLLPLIIANRGKVMNVASVAAFQPVPLMAVYAATKAYVLSFSEALSSELAQKGVTVTALCPGVTETPFLERAGMMETKRVQGGRMVSAAYVAQVGYQAMLKGQAVVVPGTKEKFLATLVNIVPRSLVRQAILKMQI